MSSVRVTRPPSDVAVEAARCAGGRVVEADLRAGLAERHGAGYAKRAVEFGVLRGALVRSHIGPVSVLNVDEDRA